MKIMPYEWPGYIDARHIDDYTDAELEAMPHTHVCNLPGAKVSNKTLGMRLKKQGMTLREAATKPLVKPRFHAVKRGASHT